MGVYAEICLKTCLELFFFFRSCYVAVSNGRPFHFPSPLSFLCLNIVS